MDEGEWSTCPICGVDLKKKNLKKHKAKFHYHPINKPSPKEGKPTFLKRFGPFVAICMLILVISGSVGVVIYHEYLKPGHVDADDTTIHSSDINVTFAEKVEAINEKALEWVDTLNVDPIWLRDEMGIKGKKKLVELLDIYDCLYRTTESSEKKRYYQDRAANVIQVTYTPDYHDMDIIDDEQFNEDSTSYLRACWIIEKLELDTTYYLKNIEKVLPRLDSHLTQRGTNQKMAFLLYYQHLGFDINYSMEDLFQDSVIRSRKSMESLSDMEVYYITHEVFFLYDDVSMYLLDKDDTRYLNEILPKLMEKYMEENDVDLLAELFMVLTYLGLDHLEIYDTALDFLLDSQNENGSFGDYEYEREYCMEKGFVIDVDYLLYLHTTEVTLIAINEALR